MPKSAPIESLEVKLMTPDDFPSVYKFLKEHFYETEPVHSYLYQTETKDFRYLDRCENYLTSIKDQTSLLLLSPLGEIAALALSGSASNINYNACQQLNPVCSKIFTFIKKAKEETDQVLQLKENDKEMCLRILCTHPNWTKRGLGKLLVEKTLAIAKNRGFSNIRAYCTSAFSANLLEKCGFECVCQIKYEDYTENGEIVFKLPPPHFEFKVMNVKL